MHNFQRCRMAMSAALLATAVSLPAAAQTPQQCQAISLGIHAGAGAQIASLAQAKTLSLHAAQVAGLILQLAIEHKPMDPKLEAALETIRDRFSAASEALLKDGDERTAQMVAATDALEAICRH